jgi:hypothetical protein
LNGRLSNLVNFLRRLDALPRNIAAGNIVKFRVHLVWHQQRDTPKPEVDGNESDDNSKYGGDNEDEDESAPTTEDESVKDQPVASKGNGGTADGKEDTNGVGNGDADREKGPAANGAVAGDGEPRSRAGSEEGIDIEGFGGAPQIDLDVDQVAGAHGNARDLEDGNQAHITLMSLHPVNAKRGRDILSEDDLVKEQPKQIIIQLQDCY